MEIAVRAYAENRKKIKKFFRNREIPDSDVVLVLDTETTDDELQDLLFGSASIWIRGHLHRVIIFHSRDLGEAELRIVHGFSGKKWFGCQVEIMPVPQFVDDIFYLYVYDCEALCIGFNLPFDLSRLAIDCGKGKGRFRNGFSLQLSKDPLKPRIRIKSLDSKSAFIELSTPKHSNKQNRRYKGRFLDLHTLGFVLTDKNLRMEKACELFKTKVKKKEVKEHGKVTKEYVEYNLRDIEVTYSLYLKMMERLKGFKLNLAPEKLYSPASLGKAYIEKIGIRPFIPQNPDFSRRILGLIMTTYYGGRSEVKIRKNPMKVRFLDFRSMYPSLFHTLALWDYLIAEKIEVYDTTNEAREIMEKADLEYLRNPNNWTSFVKIALIEPNNDILPIRAPYGDKNTWKRARARYPKNPSYI